MEQQNIHIGDEVHNVQHVCGFIWETALVCPQRLFKNLVSASQILSLHRLSSCEDLQSNACACLRILDVHILDFECLYVTMKEFLANENSSCGFLPELSR